MGENPFKIIHPVGEFVSRESGFVHALSLALDSKGELEIIDLRDRKSRGKVLSIRNYLEKWGKLPEGAKREDVSKLGLKVKKMLKYGALKKEIGARLSKHEHDILVIGIKESHGLEKFIGKSISEFLVSLFRQTTLYIPENCRPFTDSNTGKVTFNNIIIPVAEDPGCDEALDMVNQLLKLYPEQDPTLWGVHTGSEFPYVSPSQLGNVSWNEMLFSEGIINSIVNVAKEKKAELIVMTTNGRDTISQKIMGSMTEQVLRQSPCPVLAVAV